MKSIFNLLKVALLSLIVIVMASCGGKEERKAAYMEKGKAYLEEGNFEKARIEFRNVKQIDPKFAEVYYYLGLLGEKEKNLDKAYKGYTKAMTLSPEYIEPKLKMAEIYTVMGTDEYFDKAKKLLADVISLDSKNTKARLIQQQIRYKEGDESGAIKEIEKLIEEDSSLDNAINLLSSAYVAKGEIDKAIYVLDKGIKAAENNLSMRSKKAAILFSEKRFDEAEQELIEMVNQDRSIFASHLALSSFYTKRDQIDKAEQILRDGVKEDEEDIKRALVLVQFLALKKGMGAATEELDKLIAKYPDEYELHFALTKVYLGGKQNEKAKELYAFIIENSDSDNDKAHAKNLLASLLISENDTEGAKNLLAEILNEYPKNIDALKLSSKIALDEKQFTPAVNKLRTVLKSQPGNAEISKMLAQAHIGLQEYDLAETVLKNATQVPSRGVDAFLNYSSYLVSRKKKKKAEEVVASAQKIYPKDYKLQGFALGFASERNDVKSIKSILDNMKKFHPDKSEIYLKRGQYYYALKDHEKAIDEFKIALKKARTPPELLQALEKITGAYISLNKASEAIGFLRERIVKNDKDLFSKYLLGNVYLNQKDVLNAKKYYKATMEINNQWPKPYIILSDIYAKEGNINQSIALLEKGFEVTKGGIEIGLGLAGYYERNGQFKEAINQYEKILQKMPSNMHALNNVATLLLDNIEGADSNIKALEYAKKLNIQAHIAFKDTLAWAYAKTGNYQKSIEILKPVADQSPKISVFQYHLGHSLYHSGQKADAKNYLERSISGKGDFVGKDDAKKLISTY